MLFPLLIAAASPQPVAWCPATAGPTVSLPPGARRITAAPPRPLALSFAELTGDAPDAVGPDTILATVEADAVTWRGGFRVDRYTADPSAEAPVSLVCRYGRSTGAGPDAAALLVPLPAGVAVTCRLSIDARRRPARPQPTTMACTAD